MFKSIFRRFLVRRRYGAAMSELSQLSDRDLADIGVSRSEIQRLAWLTAHAKGHINSAAAASKRAFPFGCYD